MTMLELLEESPIIAAIKSWEGLEKSLKSECKVVFVLFGTICDIDQIVARIKDAGKVAIVHVDMIQGLSTKRVAVDFIAHNTRADGIISTKNTLVERAKEMGLYAIQRTFVVDSIALDTLKKQIEMFRPDAVEIMPGVMPKILKIMREYTDIPLIAGGLLSDKKDVMAAFEAGAGRSISSSQMRPGDLIFYTNSGGTINHVALYIGGGRVCHASNARDGIKISTWNYRTPAKIVNVLGD